MNIKRIISTIFPTDNILFYRDNGKNNNVVSVPYVMITFFLFSFSV